MSKAAATRLNILQKAFELVYKNGYRTTSIDEIIATTQVTKGAFFYHFKNKDEMGIAMINEVMYPGLYNDMVVPLVNSSEPITEIYDSMHALLLENPFFIVKYGCPAINLVEEMASYNETFKTALGRLTSQWQEAIATALENGKAAGKIRQDVNTAQVAQFILSGYGGIRNLGKIYGKEIYTGHLNELKNYLNNLS
ncbi:TetR/AcrR family transcriptional regulator [Flavobacterium cerinum]|uniref:TetR/AcrR family transcriptional regulator n=1 Tax=Flavobacterium cerinum TaxID=2502784 RepID=A0A3S3QUC3_9FLAO|nr:TetR/AcrR family transcriptional regulator [Flavobacterium cerinum]RWX03767.1 TetR/AcrR family transcriptional regulator [Flavobacterium cerinum]